jgi:hypothetical protein
VGASIRASEHHHHHHHHLATKEKEEKKRLNMSANVLALPQAKPGKYDQKVSGAYEKTNDLKTSSCFIVISTTRTHAHLSPCIKRMIKRRPNHP